MANPPSLRANQKVDIIFENEMLNKNADSLKAVVYDCKGREIILSQTSPVLNKKSLNRKIIVTFIMNKEGRLLRFGFSARLADIIDNYQLASRKTVDAIIIEQQEAIKLLDLRMYFRVKPRLASNIALFCQGKKVSLIDISLGGAKFISPKGDSFPPDQMIKFSLLIGDKTFQVDARVCSAYAPDDAAANKNIQYVSIEFVHDNKQLDAALGKAIIDIERQLLSEGKV